MNAGKLDTPIELQRYTLAVDSGTGERVKTWVKLVDAWSNYEPQDGGNEGIYADTRENKQTVLFTIRHRDVKVNDRVVYKNQYYNIISIKLIGRDMYIKLNTLLTE